MGKPFNKRVIQVERRMTTLETRVARLDHALRAFWKEIPVEERLALINKVEGKEDDGVQAAEEDAVGEGTVG